MARRRLLVSPGGGIAAGSPFADDAFLFVDQASPPVASSGRLTRKSDAMQSILALDASGAVETLVFGDECDSRGQTQCILIGYRVKQTGAALQGRQVVFIGGNIDPGAAATARDDSVQIGWVRTFSDGGSAHGDNVGIGNNLSYTGTDANAGVAIGLNARQDGGFNVGIGADVIVGSQSVTIGKGAGNANVQAVAIGEVATAGTRGTVVGWSGRSGTDGVGVGFNTDGTGADSICIGRDAGDGGLANCIVLGRGNVALEANSFSAGGGTTPITVVRFGPNTLGGYGGLSYFQPSAGGGTNIAAPHTTWRSGLSTGNALGGDTIFQVAIAGASGTAYQSPVTAFRLVGGTVNLAMFGDGSFGGGSRVLFIANATTAPSSNPTGGGILYVTGGALTYRGSAGTVTTIAPA